MHIQSLLRNLRIYSKLRLESTLAKACQLPAPFPHINAAIIKSVPNRICAKATSVCRLPILVTSKLHMVIITNPHLGQTALGGHPMIADGMTPIVFCAWPLVRTSKLLADQIRLTNPLLYYSFRCWRYVGIEVGSGGASINHTWPSSSTEQNFHT